MFDIYKNNGYNLTPEEDALLCAIDNFAYSVLEPKWRKLMQVHAGLDVNLEGSCNDSNVLKKYHANLKEIRDIIEEIEERLAKNRAELQRLSNMAIDNLIQMQIDDLNGMIKEDSCLLDRYEGVLAKLEKYPSAPCVLGRYVCPNAPGGRPEIYLYYDTIRRMKNPMYSLAQTYIHESFHAFFDKNAGGKTYVPYVEEAITEYATLRFLKAFTQSISTIAGCLSYNATDFLRYAIDAVNDKKSCPAITYYGFGSYLFNYEEIGNTRLCDWEKMLRDNSDPVFDTKTFTYRSYEKQFKYLYPVNEEDLCMNLLRDIVLKKTSHATVSTPATITRFEHITSTRRDSADLIKLMEETALDLDNAAITGEPIGLIGEIQAGKTRAFNGIIAKCFDLGFDIAVLFTKSSIALVDQTIKRLSSDLGGHPEGDPNIIDAVSIKGALSRYRYGFSYRKNIIVTKKQATNLKRLKDLLAAVATGKKVLIVDDEADIVSVGYGRGSNLASIAQSINDLRDALKGHCAYLQVTATPYCLYLQPNATAMAGYGYQPLRPCRSHVLNPHPYYIGGKYYFEDSQRKTGGAPMSPAGYMFIPVSQTAMDDLNDVTSTLPIAELDSAIVNFFVGAAMLRVTDTSSHYAFLLHTQQIQNAHYKEETLCRDLINRIKRCSTAATLKAFILSSYNSLCPSAAMTLPSVPSVDDVANRLFDDLKVNADNVVVVNAANPAPLDPMDGQLLLSHPYNIFIGGQSIDRGITINNLIGMFYGRGTNQMDTVLQHSRMYGSRTPEQLCVTRFYTTQITYDKMADMYKFDKDLKAQLIAGKSIVFIAKDRNRIIPCGPQRIRLSQTNLTRFKAGEIILPIGIDTKKRHSSDIGDIDTYISSASSVRKGTFSSGGRLFEFKKVSKSDLKSIFDLIKGTYTTWNDFDSHWWILENSVTNSNDISIYITKTKNSSRLKSDGSPMDAPQDGHTDTIECRNEANKQNQPVVMLLKIDGTGPAYSGGPNTWSGGYDFYWPVIVMPSNSQEYIYVP